ncbi:uncharacterized protein VTP21DRAFT_2501 [Calcarisporiella thermophila]|uniref:uncharacterized protein n=1 Tax=Calcarisporiella thermophila TaxID=911321 RepID=UPI003741FDEF
MSELWGQGGQLLISSAFKQSKQMTTPKKVLQNQSIADPSILPKGTSENEQDDAVGEVDILKINAISEDLKESKDFECNLKNLSTVALQPDEFGQEIAKVIDENEQISIVPANFYNEPKSKVCKEQVDTEMHDASPGDLLCVSCRPLALLADRDPLKPSPLCANCLNKLFPPIKLSKSSIKTQPTNEPVASAICESCGTQSQLCEIGVLKLCAECVSLFDMKQRRTQRNLIRKEDIPVCNTPSQVKQVKKRPSPAETKQPLVSEQAHPKKRLQLSTPKEAIPSNPEKTPHQISTTGAFLTRSTAKQLAGPGGFEPNPYDYEYRQRVEVLGLDKIWYCARLVAMQGGKLRVHYKGWSSAEDEWVPMGSPRIRVCQDQNGSLTEEEEANENNVFRVDEAGKENKSEMLEANSPLVRRGRGGGRVRGRRRSRGRGLKTDTGCNREPESRRGRGRGRVGRPPKSLSLSFRTSSPSQSTPPPSSTKINTLSENFTTTGAFMTRRTLRQLQSSDMTTQSGFEFNSRGFFLLQRVKILGMNGVWDTGTLIAMHQGRVRIRFDGWDRSYDEWVLAESRRIRELSEEEALADMPPEINLEKEKEAEKREEEERRRINTVLEKGIDETAKTLKEIAGLRERQRRIKKHQHHLIESKPSKQPHEEVSEDYTTTGAFMTRRAIRKISAVDALGFRLKQRIQILHIDKQWYDGVVQSHRRGKIKVHYRGWERRYDEWIPADSRRIRLIYDEANEVRIGDYSDDEFAAEESSSSDSEVQMEFDENDEFDEITFRRRPGRPRNQRRDLDRYIAVRRQRGRKSRKRGVRRRTQGQKVIDEEEQYESEQDENLEESEKNLVMSFWQYIQNRRGRPTDSNLPAVKSDGMWRYLRGGFLEDIRPSDLAAIPAEGKRIEAQDRFEQWRPATFLEIRGQRALVHYEGLAHFYDEWIHLRNDRLRVAPRPLVDDAPQRPRRTRKEKEEVEELEYVDENQSDAEAGDEWRVYCNRCRVVIKHFRYYCTYCEKPSAGDDYESFELCLNCFSNDFPFWHQHPRSSFAAQAIVELDSSEQKKPTRVVGEVVSTYEKDGFDTDYTEDTEPSIIRPGVVLGSDQGYLYLQQWRKRKICAFCNDDDTSVLGEFVGPYPFVTCVVNRNGQIQKKSFWAHDACARYSPEVLVSKEGEWYNVSVALRRGRAMKCAACRDKGATIGCFEPKCNKSYHIACTEKPLWFFEDGVIFYCPQHEALCNKNDAYEELFNCDVCNVKLQEGTWYTCTGCETFFSTFDLCKECFSQKFPTDHPHDQDFFEETSLDIIKELEEERAASIARQEATKGTAPAQRKKSLFPKISRKKSNNIHCSYCWATTSACWRKGFSGVLMCEACFKMGLSEQDIDPLGDTSHPAVAGGSDDRYAAAIEDYAHTPYLTRMYCAADKFDDAKSRALYLDTYGPAEHQLFSLPFSSSYFDIPGRAPRWATHSGTDYHGTWLPQTVRRTLLRFTRKNEKILSNFLGRGTDAIESFLLGRKCCGVDINPAAVGLSQRNCSFAIPQDQGITAEHRPIIVQADSRKLTGALFEDEAYDHVLSHPPYKDCVIYSTHIEGDLSSFSSLEEFQAEMDKVIKESWRLLRMDRRLTLGIGDNRERCFYIPVGYKLIRQYIDNGFELEELVVKRQRYCSAFGLGTYLCVQFDFLLFTHEFIVTFKKMEPSDVFKYTLCQNANWSEFVKITRTQHEIPSSPITRHSVIMGTVWTFKPTPEYSFVQLCSSRMVERFGKDATNCEKISLEFLVPQDNKDKNGQAKEQSFAKDTDEPLSEYEKSRLERIRENNQMLLSLGLISELSEESDDVSHYLILVSKPPLPPPAPLTMILVPHVSNQFMDLEHVDSYRTAICVLAEEACSRLSTGGFFIVGAQDARSPPPKSRLWPLSMLLLEDIGKKVGEEMKLKELVITVPDGYQQDRRKITSIDEHVEENCILDMREEDVEQLPIVHPCSLLITTSGGIFMAKRGTRVRQRLRRRQKKQKDSNDNSERRRLINEAADRLDLQRLRMLARSGSGFLDNAGRRRAWPILLRCYQYDEDIDPIEKHPEEYQVALDVERSLNHYSLEEDEKPQKRKELHEVIMSVLRRHPKLHYYQGFHDICTCFLLVLGKRQAVKASEHAALFFLRYPFNAMLESLEPTMRQLSLLISILKREDAEIHRFLEESETLPYFCISWILTWCSHDLQALDKVARLFDLFLASNPLMPLYVASAVVLNRKKELLLCEKDSAMIHSFLSKFPQDVEVDELVAQALELFYRYPPHKLQRISKIGLDETSAVNTYDKLWFKLDPQAKLDREAVMNILSLAPANRRPKRLAFWAPQSSSVAMAFIALSGVSTAAVLLLMATQMLRRSLEP